MDLSIGTAAFFVLAQVVALITVILLIWIPLKFIFHLGEVTQAEIDGQPRQGH